MLQTLKARRPLVNQGNKRRAYPVNILALLATLLFLSGCDANLAGVSGNVSLYWNPPLERVNGELLNPNEDIRGYEIRYRHESDSSYKTVFLDDSAIDSHHFDNLQDPSGYIFQIAVVDKEGLYSDFVTAQR